MKRFHAWNRVATLAVSIAVGLLSVGHAQVQSPLEKYRQAYSKLVARVEIAPTPAAGTGTQAARPFEFDVASIKPMAPFDSGGATRGGGPPPGGGRVHFTPGRVYGNGVTAKWIVLEAYNLKEYQLSGGPGWLDSDRFDLEEKTETRADDSQLRQMLQTLLRERFRLATHGTTKETPIYALTPGKSGIKLPEQKPGDPFPTLPAWAGTLGAPGEVRMFFLQKMPRFVEQLNQMNKLDRTVLDETGLGGTYLFVLHADPDDDFRSAVENQLGLKLDPKKAPVESLVIDRIEKPDPN